VAAFVEREDVGALACAEMEGASFRSGRVSYPDALARVTRLKSHTFFAAQSLGRIMQQGNSVHASAPIVGQTAHRLPGSRVGRVLGEVQLAVGARPLTLFVTHLSLSRRARAAQIAAIAAIVRERPRALLVGDFNTSDERELAPLVAAGLRRLPTSRTYPSWRPRAALDHALCSADLTVGASRVADSVRIADHLPLVIELDSG